MTSPTWDQYMLPVLQALRSGNPLSRRELYAAVAAVVGLDEPAMMEAVASGELRYQNRISWALTYLSKAGAVERPRRATYVLTERGRQLLGEGVPVTEARLSQFPEYREFLEQSRRRGAAPDGKPEPPGVPAEVTPEEAIDAASGVLRTSVEADLLAKIKAMDWRDFERLVTGHVLRAMGYGKDGRLDVTQATNDKGVDGIISQDPLGLDRIYVQAKKYDQGTVQAPEIHAFMGALMAHHGDRGVFITTSTFSKGAREQVAASSQHIELVDGERLAALMVTYEVGVQVKRRVPIYEVDEDFFEGF